MLIRAIYTRLAELEPRLPANLRIGTGTPIFSHQPKTIITGNLSNRQPHIINNKSNTKKGSFHKQSYP
uniref:Uncharacterized protein n=1 Tax=Arundo donax TaxID=35708 RepID=A0A0A9D6Z6_ARUDO